MDQLNIYTTLVSIIRYDTNLEPINYESIYNDILKNSNGYVKNFILEEHTSNIKLNQYYIKHLIKNSSPSTLSSERKIVPNTYSIFLVKTIKHTKISFLIPEDIDVRKISLLKDLYYNKKNCPFYDQFYDPYTIKYEDQLLCGNIKNNHSLKEEILNKLFIQHYDDNGQIDLDKEIFI